MAKSLYVGNIPYSVTDEELRQLFTQYGEVSDVRIVMDTHLNRPKGFAFVEMSNDDDAAKAIDGLKDHELGGRKIVVNEARERESRPNNDRGNFRAAA